jgi:hypothetical protein
MRHFFVVLTLVLISASARATDFGFDFRSGTSYVTDPSYAGAVTTPNSNGQAYPTLYTNGAGATITAGWTSTAIDARNRSANNDPRLSGIQFDASTGQAVRTFRVSLPAAGPYNIALAMGDPANGQTQCVSLEDNTAAFATYTSVRTPPNSFMDATGAVYRAANWVTSNATLAYTFSSTTFNVVIGCGTPGASSTLAHVRVTSASSPAGNPPAVTGISPASGPVAGGTSVTLTGTNFLTGASVAFGAAAATSVTVVSSTQITAVTPAGSAGAVNVTVTNTNGQSGSFPSGFTYLGPPTLTTVSPASGPTAGGTTVTLTGTGFVAGATVSFGPSAATSVTVVSSTRITAVTPAAPAGAVPVAVTNSNGQSANLPNAFTFANGLTLTGVSPSSGPSTGGTTVTLTGAGFLAGATVNFGPAAATSVTVVSSTQITAVTPAAPAGPVPVTVNNGPGQTANLPNAFTFANGLTLTGVSPSSGPTTGGTTVTLTGAGFLAGATVNFGRAAATSVTVVSPTQITVVTPAAPAGPVPVTVNNGPGQNANLPNAFTFVSGLTLTSVSPSSGPTTGGTTVTLTGTGFLAGATVSFGSTAATSVSVVSATQITAVTPAAAAGAASVTVTNSNGQTVNLANAFTFVCPLTLTSISPSSGPTTGGTTVTLTGTGFLTGATVSFGSTAATSVSVVSATQITAVTPAAAAGAASVTVTNSNGQSANLANAFTFVCPLTLTSLSPSSGSTTGGTTVTLTGSGFLAGAKVSFGSTAATSVSVVSATQITAVTPAAAAGVASVTVTNSNGQSANLANAFTFVSPLTLTSISPSSGPTTGGTTVTLTGTGFLAGATVSFGPTAATSVSVVSATQITAVTPAAAAGSVAVTVTNSNGQSVDPANDFTFVSGPTLTSVSPSSGSTTGGTTVTLTGSGFLTGATVAFGSVASSAVTVQSSTQITALTPAASAGTVTVTVTNSNGQSASLASAFTFICPTTLTAISPSSGPAAGGTAVTLSGTGFVFGAGVTFGGVAAASVAVVSATQITAVTPAGSAGTVSVVVTNSNGMNATLASAFTYQSSSPASSNPLGCTPSVILPVGNPTVPYYATLNCSGGTAPYTWTLLSGTLPSGLSLNPVTGLISGTPTQAGGASLTAQVSDSSAPTAQTAQVAVTLNIVTPAATDPQLPQTFINTTFPNTSGYVTRTVCASGCNYSTFQAALRAVHNDGGDSNGEIIALASGATFTENDTLPAYTMAAGKWIIVTTNTANLPAAGVRITPSYSSALANIITNNSSAAVQAASNANYYWFVGVGFGVAAGVSTNYGVFVVGNSETSVSTLPSNIVIDRCLIWGNGSGNVSRGVAANGASIAVINSYIYNIAAAGSDSQAIAAWNSPGPIKIANNFLEGSTENTLFGGADPTIPNLVNSDIEIRQNHYFKPLAWDPGDASYAGTEWQVKNLAEFKNAQRVLVEGNLMENNWAQAQDGHAVLFTPRNQDGNCSWCTVSNITFRYNVVQHSGAGFNISGADAASPCGDGSGPSLPATNIQISHVLARDISNGNEYMQGAGGMVQMLNGSNSCVTSPPANITINHLTGLQTGKTGNFGDNYSNNQMPDVVIENSIFSEGTYGWLGTNEGEGNGTFAAYFSSLVFTANVQEGGSAGSYNQYSGNYFPSSWSTVAFTDQTDCLGGTYSLVACTLQSSSPYYEAGTDGMDLGANIGAINAATYGVQ